MLTKRRNSHNIFPAGFYFSLNFLNLKRAPWWGYPLLRCKINPDLFKPVPKLLKAKKSGEKRRKKYNQTKKSWEKKKKKT
jgi:hypothetical protein